MLGRKCKNLVTALLFLAIFMVYTGSVSASTPSQVTLNAPSNGATSVSTAPTLTWYSASGATWYQVQISSNSTFSNIILDQSTTSTSLLVKSPFLSSGTTSSLLDLQKNTTYYWRVRGMSSGGVYGPWSSTRYFTTKQRRVWSPVVHYVDIGRDYYHFQGRWDSEAINLFTREQSYGLYGGLLRYRIWWESEVRFIDPTNYHGQIYSGSSNTFTNMPSHNFEFSTDEMGHQTRRPDQLIANTVYYGDRSLTRSPNQPSVFKVMIESELTDWNPPAGSPRAHWDERGQIDAPISRQWTIN